MATDSPIDLSGLSAEQTIERIGAELTANRAQLAAVKASLTEALANPDTAGSEVEIGGYAAFCDDAGNLKLTDGRATFVTGKHGDKRVDVEVPGLFSAIDKGVSGISESDAAAIKKFRHHLGEVSVLAKVGVHTTPHQQIADLKRAAKSAPQQVRGAFMKLASDAEAGFGQFIRGRGATFADAYSTATSSGNPGYQWVNDEFLPDVISTVPDEAGLYELLTTPVGGGRHATAAMKARVLTNPGGMALIGRQTSGTVVNYPKTEMTTAVESLTGPRAVWAHVMDEVDLNDPRAVLDEVGLAQVASDYAYRSTLDGMLLHGEQETAASAHVFAAAGLQQLIWKGRYSSFSGTAQDPILVADGILAWAADRSNRVDIVAGTSLSAAGDIDTSRANFLTAHNYMIGLLNDEYQRPTMGLKLIVHPAVGRKLLEISATGTFSEPLFTPNLSGANPWLVGTLIDGTEVYAHSYVSKNYSATGVPTSGQSLDVMIYAYSPMMFDIVGAQDRQFAIERVPDSEYTVLRRKQNRSCWSPLPSADKAFAVGYNVDFSV